MNGTGEIKMNTEQKKFLGILYTYGMRLRGFSPGCQPMNGLVGSCDDPSGKYYSILSYDRELTAVEVEHYELTPIGTWEFYR